MSLNNIALTPDLAASLFRFVLIDPAKKTTPDSFKFLGDNKKNILILVSNPKVVFLEDAELQFLSNILAACKLSIADTAILNMANVPAGTSYIALLHFFKSLHILLFDVEAASIDLPFNFPHFQVQKFDKQTYLSAPSLKDVEVEKASKSKLWNCLKTIFNN